MKLFAFLLAILAASTAHADMDSCYRATCRIFTGQGSGTGCVYMQDEHNYYVLTNAHVVGTQPGRTVQCVFNDRGFERPIAGQTVWGKMANPQSFGNQSVSLTDQAVVSIPLASFADFKPAIVPMAAKDTPLIAGQEVLSVGCPHGTWGNLIRGHVVKVDGLTMDFLPRPAPGRSGSAIFDATGTWIVGLLTWTEQTGGGAQTISNLHDGMFGGIQLGGNELASMPVNAQQPCPDGRCVPRIITPRRPQPPQQRPPGGYNPFPKQQNIPPTVTIPSAPVPSRPVTPAPDADPQPPAKTCDCPDVLLIEARLVERIKALESKIEQLSLAKGEPGPAGPKGDTGPAGKDGEHGKSCEIDYEKLAALVASKLPKSHVTEPEPTRQQPEPFYFEIKPRK